MAARERTSSLLNTQPGQPTILPIKIPDVIKRMTPIVPKVSRDSLRKVLQYALEDIEGNLISEESFEILKSTFTSLSEEKFAVLYAGVLLLMKYAFRHPQTSLKREAFCNELSELRLQKEFIEDICSIVFSDRKLAIERKQILQRLRLPTFDSFRWRIDVTISTSVLNRVLEPTILMEIRDTSGKLITFEVSQTKFHELRYNIAYLLKEMEELEKRNVLKD